MTMRVAARVLMLVVTAMPVLCEADDGYDIVLKNGRIIDGTGSPWVSGDVAIREGRIVAIGDLGKASSKRVIDTHGMVVAPGFIDMLGQSELSVLVDPRLPSKIYQGITTEITGEGESIAPLNEAMIKENQPFYDHFGIKPDWRTFDQYFARLKKQGLGINMGTYIGAASVRELIIGYGNRAPNTHELEQMQVEVEQAMKQGALGVSTALQYPPAPYASTDELIALAQVASRHGGIYSTHMRSEGDGEVAALDEAFRIGAEARIPVEIFHLKVAGKANWCKAPQVIGRIEAARAWGIDVAADTYAYTAWANGMSAFIPPWAHDGGAEPDSRAAAPGSAEGYEPRVQCPSAGRAATGLAIFKWPIYGERISGSWLPNRYGELQLGVESELRSEEGGRVCSRPKLTWCHATWHSKHNVKKSSERPRLDSAL